MAQHETYKIKTTWDLDRCVWEYHVYSSKSGFVITCQTLRQAQLLIAMMEAQ